MAGSYLNGKVIVHAGDCLDVLAGIEPDSVDSCVTDPPYHLASIVRRWSGNGPPPTEGVYRRSTSDEVLAAFPDTGASSASAGRNGRDVGVVFSLQRSADQVRGHDDNGGSAARFFYTAKADAADRLGSRHPTVKPISLLRWLVRLVTPPHGVCLDPFAGTGTTGQAAFEEGVRAILVEREAEYLADIDRRMEACLAGPDERSRLAMRDRQEAASGLPLFADPAA